MGMPDEIAPEDLEPRDHLASEERDIEAPDADAMEQATPVDPAQFPIEIQRGLEVSEYDAVEQALIVEMDDDYRD